MRPLTVITGILLGSCLSITLSLAAVMLIFLILGDQYPRLGHEFGALGVSLMIFSVLTTIAAVSFYLLLRDHRFRWLAQPVLWLALLAAGSFYWP